MDKENQPIALSSLTREQLTRYIQELISNDFPKLVQVLYRLDISEAKLKQTLASQPDKDAGELITQMIIERQEAKKLQESYSVEKIGVAQKRNDGDTYNISRDLHP